MDLIRYRNRNLGNQRFSVRVQLLAMCIGELSAVIARLMSKRLWSGWKWQWGVKEMPSPFPCSLVIRERSWKKTQIEKKMYNILWSFNVRNPYPLRYLLLQHSPNIPHIYFPLKYLLAQHSLKIQQSHLSRSNISLHNIHNRFNIHIPSYANTSMNNIH